MDKLEEYKHKLGEDVYLDQLCKVLFTKYKPLSEALVRGLQKEDEEESNVEDLNKVAETISEIKSGKRRVSDREELVSLC